MVGQILKLSDAFLLAGGEAIEFTLHTDAGDQRLRLDCDQFPMLVQFLALAVGHAGDASAPTGDFFPFDVNGIGVQDGESPDKTILVAKVGPSTLALQMPRSELTGMAKRLLLAARSPATGSKLN